MSKEVKTYTCTPCHGICYNGHGKITEKSWNFVATIPQQPCTNWDPLKAFMAVDTLQHSATPHA